MNRPRLETPQIVEDVYRDLRDRRLLPVVGLLAVAIVAVPIALSGPSSTPPAPPSATGIVPADAPEAQAAVLAENPGLRNYKERLDALKAKNPFHQLFTNTGLGATEVGDVSTGTSTAGGGTAAPASPATPTDPGGSVSSGTEPATAPSEPVSTPDQGGGDSDVETQFLSFRVDVFFGPDGQVKKHSNVKSLDVLNPIGLFVGATEDAKQAVFMLSADIVGVPGEGQCAPSPDRCEFLALKEGEAVEILYQPAGSPAPTVYRLRLEQIKLAPVKKSAFDAEE